MWPGLNTIYSLCGHHLHPQKHVLHHPAKYHHHPPKWQILWTGGCLTLCQLFYGSNTVLFHQRHPAPAPWWMPKQVHNPHSEPPCWKDHTWSSQYSPPIQDTSRPQCHLPNSQEYPEKVRSQVCYRQENAFSFIGLWEEVGLEYHDWTLDDWSRVIWSDETKINGSGSNGRVWVWKILGSGLKYQHSSGTLKFGAPPY